MYKLRAEQEAKAKEKGAEAGRPRAEKRHLEENKQQSTASSSWRRRSSIRGCPVGMATAAAVASSSSGGHQKAPLSHVQPRPLLLQGGEKGNVASASASASATAAHSALATMDYNYDHPHTKEVIQAMVAEEMRSFPPSNNYLSHLPYPPLKFASSIALRESNLRVNNQREPQIASSSAAAVRAASTALSSAPSKSLQRMATERLFHPTSHQNSAKVTALLEELGLDSTDIDSAVVMLKIIDISYLQRLAVCLKVGPQTLFKQAFLPAV